MSVGAASSCLSAAEARLAVWTAPAVGAARMGSVLRLQPPYRRRENSSRGDASKPSFSFKGLRRGALGGAETAARLPEAITLPVIHFLAGGEHSRFGP